MNDGNDIATAFGKVCGWTDPPHPIYSKLQQMNFSITSPSTSALLNAKRALPLVLPTCRGSGSGNPKRSAALALGDRAEADKPQSKAAKKRASASKAKAADKAAIAHLKSITNGGLQGNGPNGALSNRQKKLLAGGKRGGAAFAIQNGGNGDQGAKGAGKKGDGKKGAMATKTPDGKLICFAYGKG